MRTRTEKMGFLHWASLGTAVLEPVNGITVEEYISSEAELFAVSISSDLAEVVSSADSEINGNDGFLPFLHGGAG